MDWNEIKEARKKSGKTQIEVSREVEVSLTAFRLWESGANKPTADNLKKLKKALGV